MQNKTVSHTLILLLAAMLWGFTFVAQKIGSDYVEPYTFLACRSWLSYIGLIPVVMVVNKYRSKPIESSNSKQLFIGSILCGVAIFLIILVQQLGIPYLPTAKAGFINAMYIVLVPLFSFCLGKKINPILIISVALAIIGLFFLNNFNSSSFGYGEIMFVLAAIFGAIQILLVEYYASRVDGIKLARNQFLVVSIISTILMFIFEKPDISLIIKALPAIIFTGIVSGAIAYTLQIIGQKDLDPTIASLAMCMEGVFSAIGGYFFLQQNLKPIEWVGCLIMFLAILLASVPFDLKFENFKLTDKERE